uniref:Uncharacterized protein n=1 Tax=Rhizophora mucronata TaxID=61149 RepID=A0A2P2QQU0_RHIMU
MLSNLFLLDLLIFKLEATRSIPNRLLHDTEFKSRT